MAREATFGPYDSDPPSQPPASEPEPAPPSADTWPAPGPPAEPPASLTGDQLRAAVVAAQLVQLLPEPLHGGSGGCDVIFHRTAPCYDHAGASQSGKHWCGILCLDSLRKAGLTDALWIDNDGFIGDVLGWATVRMPQPGDIFYTERASHHAIVERVWTKQGKRGSVIMVDTIDGNTGPSPGVVARKSRRLNKRRTFYYPIAKLIAKRLAAEPLRSVLP